MKTYKDYGAPTNTTPGNEGDLYIDMNTGEVYRCYGDKTEGKDQGFVTVYAKERSNTTYTWSLVGTSVPAPGPGTGGVSSWNDLTDKPFYEYEEEYTVESTETVTEEMTVEHDGTIDENAILIMEQAMDDTILKAYFIKASDAVIPSKEAACDATISMLREDGQIKEIVLADTEGFEEAILCETKDDGSEIITLAGQPFFLSVSADNMTYDMSGMGAGDATFPEKGLYFLVMNAYSGDGELIGSLGACVKYSGPLTHEKAVTETKTRTVIETLDHKFLPYGSDEYKEIHYEEVSKEVTEEMTIEHDGTIDENAVLIVEMPMEDRTMAAYFVHVSDATISTKEDAVGAIYTATSVNDAPTEGVIREEGVTVIELEGGTIITCGESASEQAICSVSADNLTHTVEAQSVTFPKKGLYFMIMTVTTNGETASGGVAKYVGKATHTVTETITHSETKIKPIDEKFLPEPLAYDKSEVVTEEMTIEWDGVIGDKESVEILVDTTMTPLGSRLVRVSDAVFPADGPIGNYTIMAAMGGQEGPVLDNGEITKFDNLDGIFSSEGMVVSVPEDNMTVVSDTHQFGGLTFPKKGMYVLWAPDFVYISKIVGTFTVTKTEIKKIDPKFLPDTIAPKELILTSSTEGSTKQFKITVADDGTVSAVEVTA